MAYVNVAEWKTNQVCEWLKGLDNSVLPYIHSFMNHNINGQQLLNLRPENLDFLGIFKLGHQEIILEAVEYLKNFHYELDRENLQLLAMRLSCQTLSLYNELSRHNDSKPVTTQTLSDVVAIITAVKPLIRWLDQPPFDGQLEYSEKKMTLLKLSLEMATCAQRDRFAEKPIEEIRTTCAQMAKLADHIIQDIVDPMILQPSTLDLATLKKKPGDNLGFCILPSFHGAHQIIEIKFGSAAHQCGKMEDGDEIVQVNYQTVVGWERKSVLELFHESPAEILLTLKRRPRHRKIYGQIYIKPYRLPSNKKTSYTTRWQNNLPSPRPELLTIPDFIMPLPRHLPKVPTPEPILIHDSVSMFDVITTDDSNDSDSEIEISSKVQFYLYKPRNLIQRRATITGVLPSIKHNFDIEQFWKELKEKHNVTFQLRDKSASCVHGLDNMQENSRKTYFDIEHRSINKRVITLGNYRKLQSDQITFNIGNNYNSKQLITVDTDSNILSIQSINNIISESNILFEECNLKNKYPNKNKNIESAMNLTKKSNNKEFNMTICNFIELNDDFIGTSFKRIHNKQPKIRFPCLFINHKNNFNQTVLHAFNFIEHLEKYAIKQMPNNMNGQVVAVARTKFIGNVVRKIIQIEKNMYNKSVENNSDNILSKISLAYDTMKSSIYIKVKQIDINLNDNLKKFETDYGNNTTDLDTDEGKNDSNEISTIKSVCFTEKFSNKLNKKNDENKLVSLNNDTRDYNSINHSNNHINQNKLIVEPLPPNVHLRKNTLDNINIKYPTIYFSNTSYTIFPENSRSEIKSEIKLQLIPPEPPPRNYFTKLMPPSLNTIQQQNPMIKNSGNNYHQHENKPKIPERNSILQRSIKIGIPQTVFFKDKENVSNIQQRNKYFDTHSNFIYKSDNLKNKSAFVSQRLKTPCFLIDPYGYSQIEEILSKEDSNLRLSISSQSQDSSDGSCYLSQSQLNNKSRTLEKSRYHEKGMVNRAMMVARSMGLHSTIKSDGSSKTTKKKNDLSKQRNVSVKDITPGDLEGWLTYRSRGAGGAWAKAWFIMKGASLYRFKTQESNKANCVIVLSGFTASQAAEVKSRKYAFKIYYTGTIFYFAADSDDKLTIWLEAISRATLGTEQTSGLFNETDESDEENKIIVKNSSVQSKFGSLKKLANKKFVVKDHEIFGASLDRKYLKFLRSRAQNIPIPTAQFRSYRKVSPSSKSNRNSEKLHSPDLPITIAGSTFYRLNTSKSTTDVLNEYCHPTNRKPVELHGFITLKEFMLSEQDEKCINTNNYNKDNTSRFILSNKDLENLEQQNIVAKESINSVIKTNSIIHGYSRNGNDVLSLSLPSTNSTHIESCLSSQNFDNETSSHNGRNEQLMKIKLHKKCSKFSNFQMKKESTSNYYNECQQFLPFLDNNWHNHINTGKDRQIQFSTLDYSERLKPQSSLRTTENNNREEEFKHDSKIMLKNDNLLDSNGDLACYTRTKIMQQSKKSSVIRNGSFNLADHRRQNYIQGKYNWIESLQNTDKILKYEKARLKQIDEYQLPTLSVLCSKQEDDIKASYKTQIVKEIDQKKNTKGLRNFFGNKSPQKSNSLDTYNEQQKTLLGSPRLHRALFRDKSSQCQYNCSVSQNPTEINKYFNSDSGVRQSKIFNQTLNTMSLNTDCSPDSSSYNSSCKVGGMTLYQTNINTQHQLQSPIFPYIPPLMSPPPDYPGLEYPPVFEPGTYSLSDASLLHHRGTNNN